MQPRPDASAPVPVQEPVMLIRQVSNPGLPVLWLGMNVGPVERSPARATGGEVNLPGPVGPMPQRERAHMVSTHADRALNACAILKARSTARVSVASRDQQTP
jgi:hypothetical protein